ncbi:hypothetical protein GQ42DRAFT_162497 [Ramicandelaber brevisporus]|nr:hypothetical protein GQ42DRAFT_162497 [Ramicandelaber brevisporus]
MSTPEDEILPEFGPLPAPKPDWSLRDVEDLSKEMEKIPLFMTGDTPLTEADMEENVALQALQSIVYDGTPEEVAENFKNQGNECFKGGKAHYRDALEFYTKGIAEIDKFADGSNQLKATLYVNRAAVNLELGNYRKVLNDCAVVIKKFDDKNVKALYRSAKACRMLEKYEEAMDCIDRAINSTTGTEDAKVLKQLNNEKTLIEKRMAERDEKERVRRERSEQKEREESAINDAIDIRGLRLANTASKKLKYLWQNETDRTVQLDHTNGHLSWPVTFLYPEHKQSDFIEAFDEAVVFADMLDTMFEQPPEWDDDGKYKAKSLDVYFAVPVKNHLDEGRTEKLLKIGRKMTLLDVLSHKDYVITDGIPAFIILPRKSSFTDSFVAQYGRKA